MSKRKFLTAEEKVAIVRRHLVENLPVSDLCEEFGIYATQYRVTEMHENENGIPRIVHREL